MILPVIASVLLSVSVLLIFAGIAALRPRGELGRRMELYGSAGTAVTLEQVEQEQSFTQRVLLPTILRAIQASGSMMPNRRLAMLRQRLQLAGEPGQLTAVQFAGIKISLTIMVAGLAAARLYFGPKPSLLLLVSLVLFVAIGFKLPDIWLTRRIQRRQEELTNSLPDGIDMLTIAVEAGLSFDQAAGELVSRWSNELSREFRRVLTEIGVGTSRREALEHLHERTGIPDLRSFVVAVNHAEDLGTSLGQVLNVQSQEMRTRRRQRAQEKANKVPVKMMFPLVFFIFPSMFAVILGPAVPRLVRAFSGITE